jgi:hypothetical protein
MGGQGGASLLLQGFEGGKPLFQLEEFLWRSWAFLAAVISSPGG